MFYQIFLSPQVKRCAIITYKHGIYELTHEFPNDLTILIWKKLYLTEFNTKIHSNTRLAAPDALDTLTQSNKPL